MSDATESIHKNDARWRLLRRICLGLYVFYGIWRSTAVDIPIQGLEGMIVYSRMASMWDAPTLTKLLEMPWWLIATGIIPLYFVCIPFFLVFGVNLMALQLASFEWNLVGLWLVDRSIHGERGRFYALALLTFFLPVMTEMYLAASGTYTDVLLPFGIVIYVQRYFLDHMDDITALRAAVFSGVVAMAAAFMPIIFPGVLAMCIYTATALHGPTSGRLLKPLILGGAAGSLLMLPILLAQQYPTEAVYHDLAATPLKLFRLLVEGFPGFFEIRGIRYSGYPLTALFFYLIYRGVRAGDYLKSVQWSSLLVATLVFVLWLPMNSHFEVGTLEADLLRFRQYSSALPFWALFLALGVDWLHARGADRRLLFGYQGVLLVTVFSCIVALLGATNWRAFGVTAQMPLGSSAGRGTDEVLDHFTAPGRYRKIQKGSVEHRATLVMLSPMSQLATAQLGDYATHAILHATEVPPEYQEPFWVGLGLVVCEGSMRNGPIAEAALPEIKQRVSGEERGWIERGCDLGTRWRNGEIYFTELGWPPEPRVIETGAARLWGDTLRYRSRP